MVGEAAATVEFDGRVAVGDFEVKEFCVVFARDALGKVEELRADSLSAMGSFDEEFVYPGAFATIFQAVIETDHQICDWRRLFTGNVDDAINRIREKFSDIRADCWLVEELGPGVVFLHVAHHGKQGIELGGSGLVDGERHRSLMDAECVVVLYGEMVRGANGAAVRT